MQTTRYSRRLAIKSSLFGLMAASVPNVLYAENFLPMENDNVQIEELFHRYPSIDDAIVAEIVGASHFNFERVKELVTRRPELARATWDWAFGDWETALGAASHVGRRDIAKLLIDHGARPDIFTFAMFGQYEVVTRMIKENRGIEAITGPHGISLRDHVEAGQRNNYGLTLPEEAILNNIKLLGFLDALGTANPKAKDLVMTEAEKTKYLGDYRYGDGEKDGFSVKLNMRQMLSLGKLGKSGGGLYQKAPNVFTYNGTVSVEIHFTVENDTVTALTVIEPGLMLKAKKV